MCDPSLRAIAGPPALDQIDRLLEELLTLHPQIPPTIRFRLRIAVNEIAANIVKHATKGMDRLVNLQMWALVRDNDIVVAFTDDGIPVPDDLLSREMPHELEESGRGIPLARGVLSLLEYRRADGVNLWTLVSEPF